MGNWWLCALAQLMSRILSAIVLIVRLAAGVDGRYNAGARQVVNYLLLGCCGTEIYNSSKGIEELDDVVLVVSAADCFLYIGGDSAPPSKFKSAQ